MTLPLLYLGMEQKTKQSPADQGSVQDAVNQLPIPTVGDIEKWLVEDISRAVTLLNALHTDTELRRHMAAFMQGRIINARNKQELKNSKPE